MAKLTKRFRGVPRGKIYPVWFDVGDECPVELEAAARKFGALGQVSGEGSSDASAKPEKPTRMKS